MMCLLCEATDGYKYTKHMVDNKMGKVNKIIKGQALQKRQSFQEGIADVFVVSSWRFGAAKLEMKGRTLEKESRARDAAVTRASTPPQLKEAIISNDVVESSSREEGDDDGDPGSWQENKITCNGNR